jgi:putative AdoMet-dependent methyltransferase
MNYEIINTLASTYDADMENADQANVFPYDGYLNVLECIAREVEDTFHLYPVHILDLGLGTARLYQMIKPQRYELTGIDFSEKMLEIAQLKLPSATLILHDLTKGLPEEIQQKSYDVIISTYFFHSFQLDHFLEYIKLLTKKLTKFGRIYIGDAMFFTSAQKRSTQLKHLDSWREFAHYHVYEQIIGRIDEHLSISFLEIQNGAGVLIVENYNECTLHSPEVLIKY